ncbi:hypothetical protein [Ramlibacter sp. AN1133]|uniref:hypothetical protein n=1 Tax=Ramlibacter sp. AN1133 TaxID=3133429 RepID=UPI0030C456D1
MTTDPSNETDQTIHGHSGEGAASIVPHLPADRQEQHPRAPKLEEPTANASQDGGAPT